MSDATSYRFEMHVARRSYKEAARRQQECIRVDEMMKERERQAKLALSIDLKSDWIENLKEAAGLEGPGQGGHA